MVKELPKVLGKEAFLELNYLTIRLMRHNWAFRTLYNPVVNKPFGSFFTIKKEIGDETNGNKPLLHLHYRGKANDFWHDSEDVLDMDLYIDFETLIKAIKETENIP